MTQERAFAVLALGLLLAVAFLPLTVLAGTEADPEVKDVSGDSTTGRADMDVISAWVQDETNTTLTLRILMRGLDAFSPRTDWQSLPQILYDFYFSSKTVNYAARASIPVHGPLVAFASFGLSTVDYGATGDNLTFKTTSARVVGTYSAGGKYIDMDVTKTDVGSPTRGDLLTHLWAACYYQPRGQAKQTVDTAMSYQNPGRDYLVRGQFSEYYDVSLSTGNLTQTAAPRVPARFDISIYSKSTTDVYVNLTNSTMPVGYRANFTGNTGQGIHVAPNTTVSLFLIVTVPDNATNGTDVPISVTGRYRSEGQNLTTKNALNLVVSVRFIPPKPPEKVTTIITILQDNLTAIVAVIVLAAILVVVWVLYDRRKHRREEDDLVAFQSYVELQKRSRDATATGGPDNVQPPTM